MDDRAPSASFAYPIVFRDGDHAPATGRLLAVRGQILLTGHRHRTLVELDLSAAELTEVRIGRSAHDRLNGYPTVVLERRDQARVLIAPLGSNLLHEVADLLSTLSAEHAEVETAIDLIVPLRLDAQQRVRELIAQGPPFDPRALNLRRHEVLLAADHIIFAFEGRQIRQTLERTLSQPSLWRAGVAWRKCITGRPRISNPEDRTTTKRELIYSWPPEPQIAARPASERRRA